MNREAFITKPGHSLTLVSTDYSTFGGMSEIFGLATDLESLGYRVRTDKVTALTQLIFVFPSAHNEVLELGLLKNRGIRRILCLTDLNLYRPEQQKHFDLVLAQVPGSPGYFPFHKYIVRSNWNRGFSCYEDWELRTRTVIYAGGTRCGARSQGLKDFFRNLGDYSIFTSITSLDKLKLRPKIAFSSLVREYLRTKFAFLITDPTYRALGWVPQRYYEYLCCGMIPVFHASCEYLAKHKNEVRSRENLGYKNPSLRRDQYEELAEYYTAALRAANEEMINSPSILADHLNQIA